MLNKDNMIEILASLNLDDLKSICVVDKTLNQICHSEEFWHFKFSVDQLVPPPWLNVNELNVEKYKWLKFIRTHDYASKHGDGLYQVYDIMTTNLKDIFEIMTEANIDITYDSVVSCSRSARTLYRAEPTRLLVHYIEQTLSTTRH